jgi:hypothetical protein
MRERNREEREAPPAAEGGGPTGQGELRDEAERLLAAGGDLIERALSQDSTAFLAANRQEGGQ